jgi:CelD/BcsL family acetyltransferase involved in cellulose biosynthesis
VRPVQSWRAPVDQNGVLMRVSVCHPKELGPSERTLWGAFQAMSPELDNPFLSLTFVQVAAAVRDDVRVAVLSEDDRIVGFLPFERAGRGVGRPVASGVCDAQALLGEPGLELCPRDLLRSTGLHVWEFDHLLPAAVAFEPFQRKVAPASVMDVSAGYDAYMAEDGRSGRRMVRSAMQKLRKLEREVGPVVTAFDVTDPVALSTLMDWKSEQYRRTTRSDRFARPWIRELVERLAVADENDCRGVLTVMAIEGRPVAMHFGMRSERRLSLWFPAYDVELGRYSPGLLLFFELARQAPGNGIGLLDLGKGDEEYKQSLKSWDYEVAEGALTQRTPTAAMRMIRTAPRGYVEDFVLRHDSLRRTARATLVQLGRVRSIF